MPNPKTDALTEEELGYIAGIIDGEGNIRIAKNSNTYLPTVVVTNTNPILVDWLRESIGGCISVHIRKNPNHKPLYIWSLLGRAAVELVTAIEGILKLKSQQAALMLSFWKVHQSYRVKSGVLSHSEYRSQANVIVEAMSILNKRGGLEDAKSQDG